MKGVDAYGTECMFEERFSRVCSSNKMRHFTHGWDWDRVSRRWERNNNNKKMNDDKSINCQVNKKRERMWWD